MIPRPTTDPFLVKMLATNNLAKPHKFLSHTAENLRNQPDYEKSSLVETVADTPVIEQHFWHVLYILSLQNILFLKDIKTSPHAQVVIQ